MQSNGKPLKKLFYFIGVVFAPTPGALSPNVLQAFDGIAVPAAECLDDERHEGDALRAADVEMGAIFRGLPHVDGGSRAVGRAMNNSILGGGDDADVEGQLLSVNPRGDVDVGGA